MKRVLSHRRRFSTTLTSGTRRRPRPLGVSLARFSSLAAMCGALWAGAGSAKAATYYWDADGSAFGNTVAGAYLGGPGSWNLTSPLWWDGVSTSSDNLWPNSYGDTALFTGQTGLVNLTAAMRAGGLVFNTAGYNLAGLGGSLSLGSNTVAGSGTVQVNVNGVVTINAPISGNNGLTLSSTTTGTLSLGGTNTFTGPMTIASGTLQFSRDVNLGAAANGFVFSGTSATFNVIGPAAANRSFSVGDAAVALTSTSNYANGGALSGSATSLLRLTNNTFTTLNNSAGFRGTLWAQSGVASVGALDDTAGNGNIQLGNTTSGALLQFGNGDFGPIVLNNRKIELLNTTGTDTIESSNSRAASSVTINTDIVVTGSGAKVLNLAGFNAGTNVLGGSLTDGASTAPIGLSKSGASLWVLNSSANSYTGNTTLNQGTLRVNGGATGLGSGASGIVFGNGGAVLELRSESDATYRNILSNGQGSSVAAVIYLDRAIGGTGVNKTATINVLNQFNSTAKFTIGGDHGYGLNLGTVQALGNKSFDIVNNLGAPGYVAPGYTAGVINIGTLATDSVNGTATYNLTGWGDYAPMNGNITTSYVPANGGTAASGTQLTLIKSSLGLVTFSGDNSSWYGTLTHTLGTTRILGSATGGMEALGNANLALATGLVEIRNDFDTDFTGRTLTLNNSLTIVAAPQIGSSVSGKTLTFGSVLETVGNPTYYFDTNHGYNVTFGSILSSALVQSFNLTPNFTFSNIGTGALTLSDNYSLTAATTYTQLGIGGAGNTNITGTITGAQPLYKSGQGVLTLSPSGTANIGLINLNQGILRVTTPGALGGTGGLLLRGNGTSNVGLDLRLNASADFSSRLFAATAPSQYGAVINVDRAADNTTAQNQTISLASNLQIDTNGWSLAFTGAHGYSLKFAGSAPAPVANGVGFTFWNYLANAPAQPAAVEFAGGLAFNNLAAASTVNFSGAGDYLISGPLSALTNATTASTIAKNGAGVLTLSGNSATGFNTANAVLALSNGVTRVTGAQALGGALAKVNLTGGALDLRGESAFTTLPTLTVGGQSVLNVDRAVGATGAGAGLTLGVGPVSLGAFNLFTTGGANSGGNAYNLSIGALTMTGAGTVINNIGNGGRLIIRTILGPTNAVTFNGAGTTMVSPIAGTATVNMGALTKNGSGSLIFTAPVDFDNATAALTVNAGLLQGDYTASSVNQPFSSASTLTLGGGHLQIKGNAANNAAQTLGNVTVNAGQGTISVLPQGSTGSTTTLQLGTLTATANGATLLVNAPANGVIKFAGGNLAPNGRAVFTADGANYEWLTTDATGVAGAFAGYTSLVTTPAGTDTNHSVVTDNGALALVRTTASLKLTTTQAGQGLTLSGAGVLTLSTGGLFFNGADDYTISGLNGTANGLKSGLGGNADFIVSHYGAGTLNIATPILDASGTDSFTVAGTGKVVLGNSATADVNKYSGNTYVNGGTLQMLNATRLGQSVNQALVVNGGTFDLNGNAAFGVGAFSGGVAGIIDNTAVDAVTLTIGNNNGSGIYTGTIQNTGGALSIAKVGTGAITLGDAITGGSNQFTGDLILGGTGAVSFATLANAAGSHVNFTATGTGGVLTYIGNTNLTLANRDFITTGNGITATINSNGLVGANGLLGILTLNSGFNPGASTANDTLILGGNSGVAHTSWVNNFAGVIADPAGAKTAVTVSTTGAWQLSGSNTFTGGLNLTGGGALRLTSAANANGNTITISGNGTLELRSDSSVDFNTPINWTTNNANITVDRAIDGAGYGQVMTVGVLTQLVAGKNFYFRNASWSGANMNGFNAINMYGARVRGLELTTGSSSFLVNDLGSQGSVTFTTPAPGAAVAGALTLDYVNLAASFSGRHDLTITTDSYSNGVTIINGDITQNGNLLGLILVGNGDTFDILANQTAATNYTGGLTIFGNNATNHTVRATNRYSLGPSSNPINFKRGTLEIRNDASINYGNPLVFDGTGDGNLFVGEAINGTGGHNNTFTFGELTFNTTARSLTIGGVSGSTNASGDSVVFAGLNVNVSGNNLNNNLQLPGTLRIGDGTGTAITTNGASGVFTQNFGGAGITTVSGALLDNANGGGKLGIQYNAGGYFLNLDATAGSNYSGGLTITNGTVRVSSAAGLGAPANPITFGLNGNGVLELRTDTDADYSSHPISLLSNGYVYVGQLPGGTGTTGGQDRTIKLGPTTVSTKANVLTVAGLGGSFSNNGHSVSVGSLTTNQNITFTNNLSLPGTFTVADISNYATAGTQIVTFGGNGWSTVPGAILDAPGGAAKTALIFNGSASSVLNLNSPNSTFTGGITVSGATSSLRVNNTTNVTDFANAASSQLGAPGNPITIRGTLDFRTDVDVSYYNPMTNDGAGDAYISADRLDGSGAGRTVTLTGTYTQINGTQRYLYVGGYNGYNLSLGGYFNNLTVAATDNRIRNFGSGMVTIGLVRSNSALAQTVNFDSVISTTNGGASNNLTVIAGAVTQNTATLTLGNLNGILDITAVNTNPDDLFGTTPYSGVFNLAGGTVIASDGVNFGSNPAVTMGVNTTLQVRTNAAASFNKIFTVGSGATFDLGSTAGTSINKVISFGTIQPPSVAGNTYTFIGRDGYSASLGTLRLNGGTGQTTTLVANAPLIVGTIINPQSGFNSTNFDTLVLDGGAGGTITGVIADAPGGSLAAGGTARLTKQGGGVWTLANANTYTGVTNINGGTLRAGAENVFSDLSVVNLNGSAALGNVVLDYSTFSDVLNLGALNYGTIQGSGQLTPIGATITATGPSSINPDLLLTLDNAPGTKTFAVTNATDSLALNGRLLEGVNAAATVTKTGAGVLTLGANNNFTGGLNVNGGTVAFSSDAQLGASTGSIALNGGTLRVLGTTNTSFSTARALTVGASGGGFDIADAANTYTLGANVTPFSGNLTKLGAGTLTFAGPVNGNGKTLSINGGTVLLATAYTSTNANLFNIGNTAVVPGNGGSVLTVTGSGSITATGGDGPETITIGNATGSFGTLNVASGGTVNVTRARAMNGTGITNLLSGGTMTVANYAISGNSSTAVGVLNVAGGTLNGPSASGNSAWAGSRYEQNIGVNLGAGLSGGLADFTQNAGVSFRIVDNNTTGFGVVNLIGSGVLKVNNVVPVGVATGAGRSELNFHGGTLLYGSAAAVQTNFISSNLTAVNIFSEGGTIDTGSDTITVPAALLAPAGAGVDSITATGTGYFTAPYVRLTGGGGNNDATAVATIDANGDLTGIIVTNPGTGYTSAPTVTLFGGTNGTAGTATATLNSGNVSGGLIKAGAGTLILAGANTFTGPLTVAAGTLSVASGGSLSAGSLAGSTGRAVLAGSGGSINVATTAELANASRGLSTAGTGAIAITSALAAAPVNLGPDGLNLPTFSLGAAGGNVTYTGLYTPGISGVYRLGGGSDVLTYQPKITGSSSVVIANGLVNLTGANTFTGGFTLVSGGTLQVTSATTSANFGNSPLGLVSQGGTIQFAAGATTDITSGAGAIPNGLTFAPSTTTTFDLNGNNVTLAGPLGSGTGTVNKNAGAGTLTLAGAANLANPYTGNFIATTGQTVVANATALRNANVTVAAANALTFAPGVDTFTFGNLTGSNAVSNFALADTDGAAITLQVGQVNANANYSGILSGPGSLTKIGTAVETINTNAQTYAGGTALTGGTANNNIASTFNNNSVSTLQVSFPNVGGSADLLPATTFTFGSASANNLTPGGGTLSITSGSAAGSYTQNFTTTTVAGGFSNLVLNNSTLSSANTVTANLGTLVRTPVSVIGIGALASPTGGGTINFALSTTGNNAQTTTTTSANDATGIVGPWATIGLNDFAAVAGGTLVPYTGYTNLTASGNLTSAVSSNARINSGGAAVTVTAADGETTDLNTLAVSASTTAATTVTIGTAAANTTGVLRLGATTGTGAVLLANGAGSETIGNVKDAGILTAGNGTAAGELLINNATTTTGGNFITINSSIQDGAVDGVVTLVKTGYGQLLLNGTNTYTGGTIVQNGRILLNSTANNGVFGTGVITVQPGGQVFLNASTLNIANTLNLSGNGINENGNYGALRLDGGATYSGNINLIGDASISTNTGGGSIGGTVSGNISGGYALARTTGGGKIVLTGSNTYTGQTLAAQGVLQFGNGAPSKSSYQNLPDHSVLTSGPGTVFVNTGLAGDFQTFLNTKAHPNSTGSFAVGTVDAASPIDYAAANLNAAFFSSSGNVTYSGAFTPAGTTYRLGGGDSTLTFQPDITGTANLIIGAGNGTVVLTGNNTFRGGTTLASNTLVIDSLARLGNPAPGVFGIIGSGSTLRMATGSNFDFTSITGGVSLASGTTTLDTNGINNTINTPFSNVGTGAFQKGGSGTLVLGAVAPVYGWTGNVSANGGTLVLSSQDSIAPTANLTLNNSSSYTIRFNSSLTVGSISASVNSTPIFDLNGHTLTFGLNNANTTYGGIIANVDAASAAAGSLLKIGYGTTTLVPRGPATYTGATQILGGSLTLNFTDGNSIAATNFFNPASPLVLGGGASASPAAAERQTARPSPPPRSSPVNPSSRQPPPGRATPWPSTSARSPAPPGR